MPVGSLANRGHCRRARLGGGRLFGLGEAREGGERSSRAHAQPPAPGRRHGSFKIEVPSPGLYLVFEGCGEDPLHLHVAGDIVKPSWQADFHAAHEHSEGVTSVGIQQAGELDGGRLNAWISELLRTKGNDIYRMKGVLSVRGAAKRLVFQGIHMLFDAKFDREWGTEPRVNTLVFIGKNLDRAALTRGVQGVPFGVRRPCS